MTIADNPQIKLITISHLLEFTGKLVKEDNYAEYLIKNKILHKKVLSLIEYGFEYFTETEDYEECSMLLSLKNEILNK